MRQHAPPVRCINMPLWFRACIKMQLPAKQARPIVGQRWLARKWTRLWKKKKKMKETDECSLMRKIICTHSCIHVFHLYYNRISYKNTAANYKLDLNHSRLKIIYIFMSGVQSVHFIVGVATLTASRPSEISNLFENFLVIYPLLRVHTCNRYV